jgi:hypothetical protein
MALQSIGKILYPDANRLMGAGTLSTLAALTISAPGQRIGCVLSIGRSGTIDKIGVYLKAVATSAVCRMGLYTVDSSGRPTSTPYGGSTHATFTPTAAGFYEVTLPIGANASAGDIVALVVEFDAAAGSVTLGMSTGAYSPGFPTIVQYNGTQWVNLAGVALASVRFNDGTYADVFTVGVAPPMSTYSLSASSSPSEYGLSFNIPFTCRVVGLWASLKEGGPGRAYTMSLYNGTTTMGSIAVDGDYSGTFVQGLRVWWLGNPVPVPAGTSLVAAVAANTNTITLISVPLGAAGMADACGYPGGAGQVSRTGSGAWSAVDPTNIPFVGLVIDQLSDGGSVRFLNMSGGFGG